MMPSAAMAVSPIKHEKMPLMSVCVKLSLRVLVLFLAVVRPGTKMTFPGLKDDQQRASVIAYLETLKP
jgi:hypothetical protein